VAGKRANGEGSVHKRKDGRWCASITLPRGKRKHFLGKTREEVSRKLTAAKKAQDDGLPLVVSRQTVHQFMQSWLTAARPSLRERTWVRYEQYVRLHIEPALGKVPLPRLTPQHLQRVYAERFNSGSSPTSVLHLHAALHKALDKAVRWNLVARNVADLVDPPRDQHFEIATLSPEQARLLLDAASGNQLKACTCSR